MSSSDFLKKLAQEKIIAVIRSPNLNIGLKMAHAVAEAGLQLIEITWNSDRPITLIQQLQKELPQCLIGTGTILTDAELTEAINIGCQFIFTPHTQPSFLAKAVKANIPMIPGALTPTEIVTAWQQGATCVKVFPISAVGGPDYIKSLQGPLGQIPLIPTGGVTLANSQQFLKAGAIAVGLASDLFPNALVKTENWQGITAIAQKLQKELKS